MPSAKAYPIVTSRSSSYICAHNPSLSSYRRWALVLCTTCGSRGTHRECSSLRSNQKKWECEECAPSPKVTGGTEGWSGLRTGVGWGWGDLWCLRKEEGMPPDGDSMVPLVWEGKWLWKGLRTCTWEREGWVFLSHLSFTRLHIWKLRWQPLLQHLLLWGGMTAETPAWKRIRALLGLIGQNLLY